ncbi:unnamed protein product [Closterium sp. Naga37s-1]|nr:unnamed protein product [Closterium sp. Naga37s-1]
MPATLTNEDEATKTVLESLDDLPPTSFLAPSSDLSQQLCTAVKALFDTGMSNLDAAKDAALDAASGGGKKGASGFTKSQSLAPERKLPGLFVDGFDSEQIWCQLDLAMAPTLPRIRRRLKRAEELMEGKAGGRKKAQKKKALLDGAMIRYEDFFGRKAPESHLEADRAMRGEEEEDVEDVEVEEWEGEGEEEEEEEEDGDEGEDEEEEEEDGEEEGGEEGGEEGKAVVARRKKGLLDEEEEGGEKEDEEVRYDPEVRTLNIDTTALFPPTTLKCACLLSPSSCPVLPFVAPTAQVAVRDSAGAPEVKAPEPAFACGSGRGRFCSESHASRAFSVRPSCSPFAPLSPGPAYIAAQVAVRDSAGAPEVKRMRQLEEKNLWESLYEIRLERLRKRMRQLEAENLHVEARHWTMRGEVTAGSRPKNSALAADLDFEHAARPAPVITEEVTQTIEEIIKKRILNQQFDDVERKAKPVATPVKGRLELDDNPSAQGLAEIYEAQFLKAAGQAPEGMSATEQIKYEAARMFKHLCTKLDALSHFHFAPKPIMDDIDVTANVPAIAMEEVRLVALVAVSTASMLALVKVFAGGEERRAWGWPFLPVSLPPSPFQSLSPPSSPFPQVAPVAVSTASMLAPEESPFCLNSPDTFPLSPALAPLHGACAGEKAEDQKTSQAVPGTASGVGGAAAGSGGRKIRVVEKGQQKQGLSDFTNSTKVFSHIQDIRASGSKKQRAAAPSQLEPQQIRVAALKL